MVQHRGDGPRGASQADVGDDTLTMGWKKFGPKKRRNINNEECNSSDDSGSSDSYGSVVEDHGKRSTATLLLPLRRSTGPGRPASPVLLPLRSGVGVDFLVH